MAGDSIPASHLDGATWKIYQGNYQDVTACGGQEKARHRPGWSPGPETAQTTVTSVTPAATRTRLTLATGVAGAVPPTWRAIFLKSHSSSVLLSVTTA